VDEAEARRRLTAARVGHLATVRPDGRPDVVPFCFAVEGDVLYTAVDAKPKSTAALQRIANVQAHADVTVLVDHYDEDWSRLWWVRARGRAQVVGDDEALRERALTALAAKYEQYRRRSPPGPVLAVTLTEYRSWEGSGAG
jgi:PPOX class probable F420-dependent enzyme